MNEQIQFSKEIVSNKETEHKIKFSLRQGHICCNILLIGQDDFDFPGHVYYNVSNSFSLK